MIADALRRFVADGYAGVDEALRNGFQNGVEQECEEWEADHPDDEEFECPDWEILYGQAASERARLIAYYLPSINKMAGEIHAVMGDYQARLAQLIAGGMTPEQAALATVAHKQKLDQLLLSLNRRLAMLYEGIVWAAAELGHSASAQARGAGTQVWWVLDPNAEHCSSCEVLTAGSPYGSVADIGTLPGLNDTECQSRCRCHLEYR